MTQHTYTSAGSYTWTLTATSGSTTCIKTGTILISTTTSPQALPPVLFAHGICSDGTTWTDVIRHLQADDVVGSPARYKGPRSRVNLYYDGNWVRDKDDPARFFPERSGSPAIQRAQVYTITYFNKNAPGDGFAKTVVNDVPIEEVAHQLAQVVEAIRVINSVEGVDVVGHSMGGLVTRAYVEGLATDGNTNTPYRHDIRHVMTINTPHDGAMTANTSLFGPCALESSKQKQQLQPHSDFLETLNSRSIPADVRLTTYAARSDLHDSDGVVEFGSQNITSLGNLYACQPNIDAIEDTIDSGHIGGWTFEGDLHTAILTFPRTAQWIDTRVGATRLADSRCSRLNTDNTYFFPAAYDRPSTFWATIRVIAINVATANGPTIASTASACTITLRVRAADGTIIKTLSVPAEGTQTINLGAPAPGWSLEATSTCPIQAHVTIAQQDTPTNSCTFSVDANTIAIAPSGGAQTRRVTTGSGCAWSTSSAVPWITLSAAGTGSGDVTLTASANLTGAARSGTVTIAGKSVTITQDAQTVTGTRYDYLIPAIIHAPGSANTAWRTNLHLYNSSPGRAAGTIEFRGTVTPLPMERATLVIDDIVSALAPRENASGAAVLRITSPTPPIVWTRTYTESGFGTFGQVVPAIPLFGDHGTGTYYLSGLRHDPLYRTNVGLTNPTSTPLTVLIRATDERGILLGQQQQTLAPLELRQTPLAGIAGTQLDNRIVTLKIDPPAGTWLAAYASVIDNTSSDPVYIVASRDSELARTQGRDLLVAGVGRVGQWRSDLTIFNPDAQGAQFDLHFYDVQGTPRGSAPGVALGPQQTLQYSDILRSGIFGSMPDTIGALHLSATTGLTNDRYPLVQARTYFDSGPAGTYGQGIPATARNETNVNSDRPGLIAGVRSDDTYYTNVGLTNPQATPATVRVTVLDPITGEAAGSNNYTLNPYGSLIAPLDLGTLTTGTLRIESVTGASVWAYASIIDRRTKDPEYVPAVATPRSDSSCSVAPRSTNIAIDFRGQTSGCTRANGIACQSGEIVQFEARASAYAFQVCDVFRWDFDDGTAGAATRSPNHVFAGGKPSYNVSLRVANTKGEAVVTANVAVELNRVENGTFDRDLGHWLIYGSAAWSKLDLNGSATSGSVRLSSRGFNTADQCVPVVPGRYEVESHTYIPSAQAPGSAAVGVVLFSAPNCTGTRVGLFHLVGESRVPNSWRTLRGTVDVPSGVRSAAISLAAGALTEGDEFAAHHDAAVVRRIP